MENIPQKADFLRKEYVQLVSALDVATPGRWGKMNVQQMIEHMAEYIAMGYGKPPQTLNTPEEHLPRMRAFLESEKPFRENTPNALMADTPPPVRHATHHDAINELQAEIENFFQEFEQSPGKTVTNPFFGDLNYEQSVQLLHKHARHHLRQFGVE